MVHLVLMGKRTTHISFILAHSVALAAYFTCTACYLYASVSLTTRTFSLIPLCSDVLWCLQFLSQSLYPQTEETRFADGSQKFVSKCTGVGSLDVGRPVRATPQLGPALWCLPLPSAPGGLGRFRVSITARASASLLPVGWTKLSKRTTDPEARVGR